MPDRKNNDTIKWRADIARINYEIMSLNHSTKSMIAYMASTLERNLPNYAEYQKESGKGDITVIKNINDYVWSYLHGDSVSSKILEKLQDSLSKAYPDTSWPWRKVFLGEEVCQICIDVIDNMKNISNKKSVDIKNILWFKEERQRIMLIWISMEKKHMWLDEHKKGKSASWGGDVQTTTEFKVLSARFDVEAVDDELFKKEVRKQLEVIDLIKNTDFSIPKDIDHLRKESTFDGASSLGYRIED